MFRILTILTLCFTTLCPGQDKNNLVVERAFDKYKSAVAYTIRRDCFDIKTTPCSKWEELRRTTPYDYVTFRGYYQIEREKRRTIQDLVIKESKERSEETGKVLKLYLDQFKDNVSEPRMLVYCYYYQTGELMQLLVYARVKEDKQMLTDDLCYQLFQEIDSMHIISPWEEKDYYWISLLLPVNL